MPAGKKGFQKGILNPSWRLRGTRREVPYEERFWSYVDKRGEDECWPWTGWIEKNGYARVTANGRRTGAHRLALELFLGRPIPKFDVNGKELCVLHSCDNRKCCNPKHLREGTKSDNTQEALAKGRWHDNTGENHGGHKHTWAEVTEMRRLWQSGMKQIKIAELFHIRPSEVSDIVTYKSWKIKP